MAIIAVVALVLLLGQHASGFSCPDNPDVSTWCGKTRLVQCYIALNETSNLENFKMNSGSGINDMGNLFNCETKFGNICIVDVLAGQDAVITQGLCLPAQCSADDLRLIMSILECANTTAAAKNYLQTCQYPTYYNTTCKPKNQTDAQCQTVFDFFAAVIVGQFEKYFEKYSKTFQGYEGIGVVDAHCGSNAVTGVTNWQTVLMIIVTTLLVLANLGGYFFHEIESQEMADNAAASASINKFADETEDLLDTTANKKVNKKRSAHPSFLRSFFRAFSPLKNVESLVEKEAARSLTCLDGMRTISMLWIISGHIIELQDITGFDNPNAIVLYAQDFSAQFTQSANFAVDTFFFLSGLLTTYALLRRLRKTNKTSFPIAMYIFLRYLRLTVLYGFVLGFYATLLQYVSSGPIWYRFLDDSNKCINNAWQNFLYINNFLPSDFNQQCMAWTWYLANDFQFFILGILILAIYLKAPKIGVVLTAVCIPVSILTSWIIVVRHNIVSVLDPSLQSNLYVKPYCRVGCFAIGMLIAYWLCDRTPKIRLSWYARLLWTWLGIGILLSIIYITMNEDLGTTNLGEWGLNGFAGYNAFARIGFGVGIAILVMLCGTGNGGFVNTILSLPVLGILGKLTYGAYLVHPIIIRILYASQTQVAHMTSMIQVVNWLGVATLSYMCSAVLYVLVELPSDNMVKLLVAR